MLDKHPGAAAAYSLRKLSAKYAGPAIKVRRASDSLEADVYFDSKGEVSFSSIVANVPETTTGNPQGDLTFNLGAFTFGEFVGNANYSSAGATDAFVVVWYDQSSKGNDAQQLTAANQPKIHDATTGMVVDDNRKPAVSYDTSSKLLQSALSIAHVPLSFCLVQSGPATQADVTFDLGANNNEYTRIQSNAGGSKVQQLVVRSVAAGLAAVNTSDDFDQGLITVISKATNDRNIGVNGGTFVNLSTDITTIDSTYLKLGSQPTEEIKQQEIIIWSSDQSTNRTNIESDINNHYSIFTPELELGLINEFDGAAAAYSLRLLNYFYQGPLVRVRRDSDHVEVDVYPDENGVFSERSLVKNAVETSTGVSVGSPNDSKAFRFGEFAYGANCFVVEWKDQSSNNNHASQDASANQPKIYDSATGVVTENGKPALTFDSSDFYTLTSTISIDLSDGFAAFNTRNNASISNQRVFIQTTNGGLDYASGGTLLATEEFIIDGDPRVVGVSAATGLSIYAYETTASTGNFYKDGSLLGTDAHSKTNTITPTLAQISRSSGYVGNMSELIIYASDQSTNRTDIEDNINTFYNIF